MAGLSTHGAAYEAAFQAMIAAGAMPIDLRARYPLLTIDAEQVLLDDAAIERGIADLVMTGRGRVDILATVRVVLAGARKQREAWVGELVPYVSFPLAPDRADLFKLLGRAVAATRSGVGDDERSNFRRDAILALQHHPADGGPPPHVEKTSDGSS